MQTKIGDGVIVAGKATKDAELKIVGDKQSPVCSFSLAVGKRQDTTTIFANCKAWYALAEYASQISKGDSVMVVGKLEEREYNGKQYTDVVAEWINVVKPTTAAKPQELSPSGIPYPKGATFTDAAPSKSAFSEIDSGDGELPF